MANNTEIANTILSQMGGTGKLKAMIGANNFIAIDNGVQFSFKGCKSFNKIEIVLTSMDLYDIKFYKINMRNLEKSIIPASESSRIYVDQLVEVFEHMTGLYLHI